MENWIPIPGRDGYEVSDLGRVRSLDREVPHRTSGKLTLRGRILKPSTIAKQYPAVTLQGKLLSIHSLVLLAFRGEPKTGEVVRHLNGNPRDNRLENLEYGTPKENSQDMVRHRTQWQQKKTHCPAGHLLEVPNLMPSQLRRGHRQCLACGRARTTVRIHPELTHKTEADRHYRKIVGSV